MSRGLCGPGRLVLVVGPSGAGKDTIINGARAAFLRMPHVIFPRRVVTRPSSASEDHDSVSLDDFDHLASRGGLALTWEAHGHKYGIPQTIDDEIRAGGTVVCNVSRTIVAATRDRYASVAVVLVTAPPETLAARLQVRGREASNTVESRLRRNDQFAYFSADHTIVNERDAAQAVHTFVKIIQSLSR